MRSKGVPHRLSPKDDLIALGYSLLFLAHGDLPWLSVPVGSAVESVIGLRAAFAFPSWFNSYRELVMGMMETSIDYSALVKLFTADTAKKPLRCEVSLQTGKRAGCPCHRALPCQYHGAGSSRVRTSE